MLKKQKECFKRLSRIFTSHIKKKCISLLLILILLASNLGISPKVYAANQGSISNNPPVSTPTLKVDNRTPISSLTNQVYGIETAQKPNPKNDSLTGNVYVEQVDKEIDYPIFPNPSQSSNKGASQPNGVFMKHFIHMPKIDEKPVPFNGNNDNALNGQNPALNQNSNNPGIASSMNGSVPSSPKTLAISDLKEVDENDLNLIDVESTVNQNQDGSVTGSVYNGTSGKILPSQENLNRDSVAPSVYSVVGKANASFPIRNKAGNYSVGFSSRTDMNLFRFSLKNANLTLSPLNLASVSGNVYKNSISYEEIYPNTDLRYTVEKSRLKEEIVVKKYTGKSDFFFQMSVENAVYKVMPDSSIMFYDSANQPIFYIPRGFAVDSNGNRCDSVNYEFTPEGLLKVSVDPNWLQQAAYPVVIDPTINLFDATFSRNSVAYKHDGTQVTTGSPRYETGKFNQGIMLEEGTTNLLTANQSSVETDLSGLAIVGSTKGTLSRITTDKWTGSASAQVIVSGYVAGDDINLATADPAENTDTAVSPNTTYTASFYFKGAVGTKASIRIIYWNASGGFVGDSGAVNTTNGNGAWQRITYTFTTGSTAAYINIRAFLSANGTYLLDGFQIEQKAYATSWIPGGSSRSPETMTIPSAGVFSKGNWSVEMTFIPTSKLDGVVKYGDLWEVYIDSKNVYHLLVHETGRPYFATSSNGTEYNTYDSSIPVMQVGVPYAIMVSGNGSVLTYYVNGVQYAVGRNYVEPLGLLPVSMGIGSGTVPQANGIIDDLRISNRARTAAEAQAAYQSNQPLPVDPDTTCKLSFDSSLHAYPTVNSIDTTFSRPSVAYKQDGIQVESGSPRYETGKFNQGIMLEEGTTNLLTVNQSSVETDLSGLAIVGSTKGTLSRITTDKWTGSASAQVVVSGYVAGDDINLATADPAENTDTAVSPNTTYTASFYFKGAVGTKASIRIIYWNASGGFVGDSGAVNTTNGNGAWQRITYTFTTGPTAAYINIRAFLSANGTYLLDGFQIEQKAYATSWIPGGSTRSPENLTIPTAGVFSKGNWTVEMTFIPTSKQDGILKYGALWDAYIDSKNIYRLLIHETGRPYFATVSNGTEYNTYDSAIPVMQVGVPYTIMVSGNGSVLTYYVNGVQYAVGRNYVEPLGLLPVSMGIGSGTVPQANGIIDDLRISNRARTAAEAQAAYQSNQPLPVNPDTTCKLSFDSSTGGYTTVQSGPGVEQYWNYTSTGLGGGWQASVNTWNLNLILSKPLFLIPGRGMPIGESITYNSIQGKNWTFGNNTSVVESYDGTVVYNKSDGGSYTFTPNGSGGYTAPPGVYLTLQKNGTGNFTILDKQKNTYNYVNGKPNQFTDRNNNITTFTYDGSGRLYQVSDPSGRKLTYAYDAGGRVVSITDPANNAYQFGYQNDYLTTVTNPANKTFTLSYDANGRVASFTDPLNRVTSFYGNPNGQIMRIRDPRTNGQDVYETSFTQALEGNSIVTIVTDPGNKTSSSYHDNNTGNLTKYQDALGNTWQYVWINNNLTQTQDAKGQTTYQYDSWGNVKNQTTTVDSNPGNNIIKTMTYDDYNQLQTVIDGSGRMASYKYSNRGDLLSTSNPDTKESNGRRYDQYGNTVEYSPAVLGDHNLVRNGSMEIAGTGGNLLANWTRVPGAATVSLEGFNSHVNSALKMSSSTSTTEWFYQQVSGVNAGDKLTLRADIKLDNVQSSTRGVEIKIMYGNGSSEGWAIRGSSAVVPFIMTSQAASSIVTIYIGLNDASGTAWLDGVQLEKATNPSEGYILGGFNSVENSGFEQSLDYWGYTGATPVVTYEAAWEGIYSSKIYLPTSGTATLYQDIPVYDGEPLTFSGMVKTNGISGNGAYYKIDYYDALNNLISGTTVQTGYVTGTQDWTSLSTLATAPTNAKRARVQGIIDGSGTAYYDAVKLIPRISQKYVYDTAGNYVLTEEDALGKQNKHTYNQNTGRELSFTDAWNNTTTYGYDNLNRLVQVTDPYNRSAYYEYDSVSNQINTRDQRSASANDNTYRTYYGPNNLNMLANLTDPLNQNVAYTYDRSGNLTEVSLPNGLKEDYSYDGANRLIKTTLDGGKYFTYAYDGANELTGVSDQDNNSYSWNYDGAHRLTISTDTFSYGLNYQWDKSNNLKSLSGSDYGSNQYFYGSDNKLLSMTLPNGSSIFYDYDENGRVFLIRYPGSYNSRSISYLPNGRIYKISDVGFPGNYSYLYNYNDTGTISMNASWDGWDRFAYYDNGWLGIWRYDPIDGGTSIQENYSYDAAGNLLTKGSKTFTYNSANQITNTGFTYDANGNLTGDGNFIYAYNALNQLVQVKKASDSSLVATYTYNHNGLRRSKTVNGVTTNYNWDASGHLIRESTPSGSTYYYYGPSGDIVGLKKNNITYITHNNLRGDIVSITDPSNNIVAQYHFDPWGNQISYSGSLSQPIRYAGYYYDEETGLYYLKNRYYSPQLGRFLTKDSYDYIDYKDPKTLNLYSYANNNPVNNIDPTGHFVIAVVYVAGEVVIEVALLITSIIVTEELDEAVDNRFYSNVKESSEKERSKNPPAIRDKSNSKKDAYEKAKRAGRGNEPINHPNDEHGPHYHPNVPMPKDWTPKAPNPHDHYFYPK